MAANTQTIVIFNKVRGKTVPGGQNCPVSTKWVLEADLEGASGS